MLSLDFYLVANMAELFCTTNQFPVLRCFLCIICSTSKKDVDIRRRELLEAISPAVLNYLNLHAEDMVMDKATCVVVPGILRAAIGDIQPVMKTIASLAAKEMVPGGKDGEVIAPDSGNE